MGFCHPIPSRSFNKTSSMVFEVVRTISVVWLGNLLEQNWFEILALTHLKLFDNLHISWLIKLIHLESSNYYLFLFSLSFWIFGVFFFLPFYRWYLTQNFWQSYSFRRGSYPSTIFSLSFGPCSQVPEILVATSSSGSVHVFPLGFAINQR